MNGVNPAIQSIGSTIAEFRAARGVSQQQLADQLEGVSRTMIAHAEQGLDLPGAPRLEAICNELEIPRRLWIAATRSGYLQAMEFESHLANLLGKPVSLSDLDATSQVLAVDSIQDLLTTGMSEEQYYDQFNAVLTFYGEKPVSNEFFAEFLGRQAFSGVAAFRDRIVDFQRVALRLYGNFRQAYKRLSSRDNSVVEELSPLQPVNETTYTARRPFHSIDEIPVDRLDDLGYISVERVKRESRERQEIHDRLIEIAGQIRSEGPEWIDKYPPKRLARIQTLLRQFDSSIELEPSLFGMVDAETLEAEATRLAPEDSDLARIENTQEMGLRNLSTYLTEPYMDVYVATSMRERADFVAVDEFSKRVFGDPEVRHLHLRYFNPTQSWVSDRVAKGLVEALMLRRASATIYMAQKGDTFGKDSEASVALGQGKPVIVYVPRLFHASSGMDSEELMQLDDRDLLEQRKELGLNAEEGLDRQAQVAELLKARLDRLDNGAFETIVALHWADFDIFGELKDVRESHREAARRYLDGLSGRPGVSRVELTGEVREVLTPILVRVAVFFERRAVLFREIHPLALQVILTSGVLNGILVVRSPETCARVLRRLLTNTIDTEVRVDDHNYRLVEHITGSTLRVISKHRLLSKAFWTQYFDN